jgi:hypothetical protein
MFGTIFACRAFTLAVFVRETIQVSSSYSFLIRHAKGCSFSNYTIYVSISLIGLLFLAFLLANNRSIKQFYFYFASSQKLQ